MTLEEVKQQIATKYGYANFKAVLNNYWASERYVNEAIELFAEMQVKNITSNTMLNADATNWQNIFENFRENHKGLWTSENAFDFLKQNYSPPQQIIQEKQPEREPDGYIYNGRFYNNLTGLSYPRSNPPQPVYFEICLNPSIEHRQQITYKV
jgi:hypothetical protein